MMPPSRTFLASVAEVGEARRFATAILVAWGSMPDDVVLVVSELAANAVRHACSDFEVALRQVEGAVAVEVTDTSPDLPRAATPGSRAGGGRGLLIIDRLARSWGVRPGPCGGKTVWAEVPTA